MRLFLKIFLSYWLALALFLVLAILTTLALRPPRENTTAEAQQTEFLANAVRAYQSGGSEEARRYLRGLRDSQHVWAFLFDEQGQEVTGRRPPEWIERVRLGQTRTIDSFWGRFGLLQFLRPSTTGADGRRYTMVIQLPPEQHALFGPHGMLWLVILIAIISSGLVCYILARYMTGPVVRLRAATQRLAAGDLSARAGGSGARGNDEIAQLVRDFDAMAERLEKSVNAQARLLNDISHELRSPLARLNVALALARQRSGPPAQSALERIDLESNRLNELIGGLLTIARMEDGNEAREKSPIRLADMIEEIAQDADYEAQGRNCHVECLIADDCWVMGAPILLHSAIENVVRNATHYTREGTVVHVHLEQAHGAAGPEAVIRVSDSGYGVPEEALDKLFRPFYRIDDARGRQTGGIGLGLAITERAVRLHGGTVRAANRMEGGLVVEIRLPRASVNPTQIQPAVVALQADHD
jgi:two-component system, OmpR family, sensor histidine kinase CpxA